MEEGAALGRESDVTGMGEIEVMGTKSQPQELELLGVFILLLLLLLLLLFFFGVA